MNPFHFMPTFLERHDRQRNDLPAGDA